MYIFVTVISVYDCQAASLAADSYASLPEILLVPSPTREYAFEQSVHIFNSYLTSSVLTLCSQLPLP